MYSQRERLSATGSWRVCQIKRPGWATEECCSSCTCVVWCMPLPGRTACIHPQTFPFSVCPSLSFHDFDVQRVYGLTHLSQFLPPPPLPPTLVDVQQREGGRINASFTGEKQTEKRRGGGGGEGGGVVTETERNKTKKKWCTNTTDYYWNNTNLGVREILRAIALTSHPQQTRTYYTP